MRKRESISLSEQYSICSKLMDDIDETIIRKAIENVSEIFSVSPGIVRLNDVIGQDLGRKFPLSMFESMACEDFYMYIESQEKKMNVKYEDPITTVLDFVKFEKFLNDNGNH